MRRTGRLLLALAALLVHVSGQAAKPVFQDQVNAGRRASGFQSDLKDDSGKLGFQDDLKMQQQMEEKEPGAFTRVGATAELHDVVPLERAFEFEDRALMVRRLKAVYSLISYELQEEDEDHDGYLRPDELRSLYEKVLNPSSLPLHETEDALLDERLERFRSREGLHAGTSTKLNFHYLSRGKPIAFLWNVAAELSKMRKKRLESMQKTGHADANSDLDDLDDL